MSGVKVTVDHVNGADLPAAIFAEVNAGEGHDLIEFPNSLAQYEPAMLDLGDVVEEANRRHGDQLPMAKRSAYNPTTDTHWGFAHGYATGPGNHRKSLWATLEMPDGPSSW